MKLRLFIASLITLLTLGLSGAMSVAATTNNTPPPFNPLQDPCKSAPDSPACQQNKKQNNSTTNPVADIIHTATNIIALVAGIAAVIIVIISGFMVATAGGASPGQRSGDPNKIKTARSALAGSLIGLVIIALAWTIITFVTNFFVKT